MAAQREETRVFNIQRYSVHDGPGIRTIVFLQGCPLRCPWCANPEGRGFTSVLSHNRGLCRRCGHCLAVCPEKALRMEEDGVHVDRSRCTVCEKCVWICGSDCYKIFGESVPAEEVLREVGKDESFYFRSGGGMTVSGGEPLAHPEYLTALLRGAKEQLDVSTAIETCCCAPEESLRRIIKYVDTFLCDIKIVNSKRSHEILGVPSEQILHNIRIIADEYSEKALLLRMPVIPGYTDGAENVRDIAAFINTLKREVPLELLPYHEFGKAKYASLGLRYPMDGQNVSTPSREWMESLAQMFRELGVTVVHT